MNNEGIGLFVWVILVILLIGTLKAPWFKGMVGESLVKLAARIWLPSDRYKTLHNVTLRTQDGTTQVDHIIVSRFGVFIIETKHMKGWIFGAENQPSWTQKIYGKSFKFQNPLRQNYKHVKAIEAITDLPMEAIVSVVVFTGACTIKTQMPNNVTMGLGYISYIKSYKEEVLSDEQVQNALSLIRSERLVPTRRTHIQHVRSLKARSAPEAIRLCPRCGNKLVLRVARRGVSAGKKFWGCSRYPACRHVVNLD